MSVVIRSVPVMTKQVYAVCEACGTNLVRNGKVQMHKDGERYQHDCKQCKTTYLLSEAFPVVRATTDLLTQYHQAAETAIVQSKN